MKRLPKGSRAEAEGRVGLWGQAEALLALCLAEHHHSTQGADAHPAAPAVGCGHTLREMFANKFVADLTSPAVRTTLANEDFTQPLSPSVLLGPPRPHSAFLVTRESGIPAVLARVPRQRQTIRKDGTQNHGSVSERNGSPGFRMVWSHDTALRKHGCRFCCRRVSAQPSRGVTRTSSSYVFSLDLRKWSCCHVFRTSSSISFCAKMALRRSNMPSCWRSSSSSAWGPLRPWGKTLT
jgi:hypothetical protein